MADTQLPETRTFDQLPLATAVSPDALTGIQEPGGPMAAVPIRALLGRLISTETAYETEAELQLDVAYDEPAISLVFADPDPAKSGWYRKVGAAGAGNWVQFERLSDQASAIVEDLIEEAQAAADAAADAAGTFDRTIDQANLFTGAQLAFRDLALWTSTQPLTTEVINGRRCLKIVNGIAIATFPRSAFAETGLISASVVVEKLTGADVGQSRLRIVQRSAVPDVVGDDIASFGGADFSVAATFAHSGIALHADTATVDFIIQSGPTGGSTAWVHNLLLAQGGNAVYRPSPYQPAEPKWQRLVNRVADPGFAKGIMPDINVGQPVMEAIADTTLTAMGAVNGFKMTGSASAQVFALYPVPEGAAGKKYVLMAAYAYSPDGVWSPSASNSVYQNAAGGNVTAGLKHEFIDITANVRLYVSYGLIPADAAKFAIGKFDLQASGVTNRLLTGIGYWLSDVPISRDDVIHDIFTPASLVTSADSKEATNRVRASGLTYEQPNRFTRDQLTFDDLTGWQKTGMGAFAMDVVNGRRCLKFDAGAIFRDFDRWMFEESGEISASLWIEKLEGALRTSSNFIVDQLDGTGAIISTAAGVRGIVNMGTGSYSEPRQLKIAGLPLHADCATVRFQPTPNTSGTVWFRDMLIAGGSNPEFRLPPVTASGGGSAGLSGTITIASADNLCQLGDSYTEAVYPLKDKHPAARVAEQSDWRVQSWGVSGYDNAELTNALLTGMERYGTSFAEIAPSHTIIVSRANDNFIASLSWRYWQADAERLIGTVKGFGSEVILSAEHPKTLNAVNWAQERSIADAHGLPFIDVASDAHKFEYSTSQYIWEGTHPGVRTNSVLWKPILDFVQTMPRPRTGLRLFRPRATHAAAARADVRYDSIPQRARIWKELTTGHRGLKLSASSKYDAVAAGANKQVIADQEWYDDEYMKLARGEALSFTKYVLIEAILPAMGRDVDRVKLNITGTGALTIYALDRREPPPFELVNMRGFVGASEPATVGDVYDVPDSSRFAVVGNIGDMVILRMGDGFSTPDAAGTLTRYSGTGPATIDYTGVISARDPEYYDHFDDPVGTWESIAGGEISGSTVQRYMQGDKIAFLIEAAGAFTLTSVGVEYDARQEKPTCPALLRPATGAQLLAQPLCGEAGELAAWTITGAVAGTAPDANSGAAPSGVTKLARIDDANYIDQTFDLPADRPNGSELEIEVWCRRYLPMFDPTADIATSAINHDTFDHATLQIGFGLPGDNLDQSALADHLVPPGWVAIKHRVQVPSQYVGPGDGLTRRLTIKGGDDRLIEVARVTARMV